MATTTDALIMAGTGMPVVDQAWVDIAMNHYIAPTVGGAFTATPVVTPSQFYPFTGPTDLTLNLSVAEGLSIIDGHIKAAGAKPETDPTTPIVVFGYSQSAVIATFEKRQLATRAAQGESVAAVEFILAANPNRPNGGLSARFPGLTAFKGWTFSEATPTDTPFHTVDIAKQYDFFADFPRYPANLLADLNVLIGLVYGTHNYATATLDPTAPGYHPDTVVQQLGDTTYYFIPADTLPLLLPLHDLGVDPRVLDAIEPVLRVLVEAGYDRTTAYGEPAPAELFPRSTSARSSSSCGQRSNRARQSGMPRRQFPLRRPQPGSGQSNIQVRTGPTRQPRQSGRIRCARKDLGPSAAAHRRLRSG
ncbi:hypothetical protein B1R94_00370 [Mycolicibacterium litorale]|nr:hypothetical protein B1R94_00370 [Mycolicibacterium litorale]